MYRLPRGMRSELRKPLGRVFRNTRQLVKHLYSVKAAKLIAVGDVCSRELITSGVLPDVVVIDNKTKRRKTPWNLKFPGKKTKVRNEPATISGDLVNAVKKSFRRRTLIDVKGEEDLAVLPAIKHCPLNSIVVYGLWFRGVVAVNADKRMKNKANRLLERMRHEY
ncbi:MAG: DUF359 domain-containing protein [Candidatus Aenigmarchaeota archaeon]|nr:DUF359 domain-containing protein [Candidatus Aenigmarchaeota archaeon]